MASLGSNDVLANAAPSDANPSQSGADTRASRPAGRQALSVLIVDDEPGIRDFLERALAKEYGLVETAGSVEEAEEIRSRCHFDLMIVDICLPGSSGMEWLKSLQGRNGNADVIFMTAYADMHIAIDALRVGASDFILKPFRLEQMQASVRRCMEKRLLARENFVLRRQIDAYSGGNAMVGSSAVMQEIADLIARVAPTPSVVLIEGESGTGKELVAKAIHKQSRRSGSFVPVNCGAIAAELIESELFGHTKGAFTGAQQAREGLFAFASGGTLFLDEIGEMPLPLQAKLLRVLEDRKIRPVGSEREITLDVRIITATNRDLQQEVEAGRFREDLYYRLNVLAIRVPSLRERREDVEPLLNHFSKQLAADLGLPPIPFSHADFLALASYDWPGNVRELKNLVERCLLLGRLPGQPTSDGGDTQAEAGAGYACDWSLDAVEKHHILKVLQDLDGNKTQAAQVLGVARKTLDRKLNAWGSSD